MSGGAEQEESPGPAAVRAAVDAHVDALNHGDLDDIVASFTDDAVFVSDGGHATGHRELASLFRRVTTQQERPWTVLRRAQVLGDTLDCTLTRRFVVTDGAGRIAAAHEVDVHAVFTVRDGAVARVEVQLT